MTGPDSILLSTDLGWLWPEADIKETMVVFQPIKIHSVDSPLFNTA